MSRAGVITLCLSMSAFGWLALASGAAPAPPRDRRINIPILVYHRVTCLMGDPTRMDERMSVSPEDFARQMQQLRDEGYTPIALEDARAALDGSTTLPPKPIAITFDDGWITQYTEAVPVLRRLGFKATFFIFADAIGTPDHMTWEQVRELRASGMEIGSHTLSHARLPGVDPWPMWKELAWSKDRIEHELNEPIDLLAYPFGEYDPQAIEAALRAGYHVAVTTDPGTTQSASETMRLHRVYVGYMDGPSEFEAVLRAGDVPGEVRTAREQRTNTPRG